MKTLELYAGCEPGHPNVLWRRVVGVCSEGKSLKCKGSIVAQVCCLSGNSMTALPATCLTRMSVAWREEEAAGTPCMIRAAAMPRL